MGTKTRELFIWGVTLFLFGPTLGFMLLFVVMFFGFHSLAVATATLTPPEALRNMDHIIAGILFVVFAPLLVGILNGVSGMFLIIFDYKTNTTITIY